jgi:hypothetical protein
MASIKNRINNYRNRLKQGKAKLSLEYLRNYVQEAISESVDNMGTQEFCMAVEKMVGKKVFSKDLKEADSQIATSVLLQKINTVFDKVEASPEFNSPEAIDKYCDQAEKVLQSMKDKDSTERTVDSSNGNGEKAAMTYTQAFLEDMKDLSIYVVLGTIAVVLIAIPVMAIPVLVASVTGVAGAAAGYGAGAIGVVLYVRFVANHVIGFHK